MKTFTAICIPDFFPRISVFSTILQADRVILADTFQYSRQSYQNRTSIRTDTGVAWLSVPVRYRFGDPIHAVTFEDAQLKWRESHLKTLQNHYRSSAMYDYYESSLASFYAEPYTTLGQLSAASLRWLCKALAYEVTIECMSDWGNNPPTNLNELSMAWLKPLLTTKEAAMFAVKAGLNVHFVDWKPVVYRQVYAGFYPDLSMLDLLFNYGPEALSYLKGFPVQTP
ncbi:MAG: WbqC family protein [Bacteroidetes Order II. Incertae sedis bacterium]|nr:WbqC family protein [Bacteroidetes Order II. bacterium]